MNSFTYDAGGNPVTYLGHTLTWEKGRQLKSFDANTYTYNANGIRTSKTVDGVTHRYILNGTKILKETWGENYIIPLYDNANQVSGIIYNDSAYYFLKNLQGDIIAITDNAGKTVATYKYDAWGECTIISDTTEEKIASINPYRYRTYYYDTDTGFYYLNSRYYDPKICRFINADDARYVAKTKFNIFAYCNNCPIKNIDAMGFCSYSSSSNTAKFTSDLIGFGLRILVHVSVNKMNIVFGLDLVWYPVSRNNFAKNSFPFIYFLSSHDLDSLVYEMGYEVDGNKFIDLIRYMGGSINENNIVDYIMGKFTPDLNVSIYGLAVFGDWDFDSPGLYAGWHEKFKKFDIGKIAYSSSLNHYVSVSGVGWTPTTNWIGYNSYDGIMGVVPLFTSNVGDSLKNRAYRESRKQL